jgi:cytidine deaminase
MDLCCGLGLCAEHAAIAEMLKNGENEIAEIIAVGQDGEVLSPCGRCRELMMQMGFNEATVVHLPNKKTVKLAQLLPDYWIV